MLTQERRGPSLLPSQAEVEVPVLRGVNGWFGNPPTFMKVLFTCLLQPYSVPPFHLNIPSMDYSYIDCCTLLFVAFYFWYRSIREFIRMTGWYNLAQVTLEVNWSPSPSTPHPHFFPVLSWRETYYKWFFSLESWELSSAIRKQKE